MKDKQPTTITIPVWIRTEIEQIRDQYQKDIDQYRKVTIAETLFNLVELWKLKR